MESRDFTPSPRTNESGYESSPQGNTARDSSGPPGSESPNSNAAMNLTMAPANQQQGQMQWGPYGNIGHTPSVQGDFFWPAPATVHYQTQSPPQGYAYAAGQQGQFPDGQYGAFVGAPAPHMPVFMTIPPFAANPMWAYQQAQMQQFQNSFQAVPTAVVSPPQYPGNSGTDPEDEEQRQYCENNNYQTAPSQPGSGNPQWNQFSVPPPNANMTSLCGNPPNIGQQLPVAGVPWAAQGQNRAFPTSLCGNPPAMWPAGVSTPYEGFEDDMMTNMNNAMRCAANMMDPLRPGNPNAGADRQPNLGPNPPRFR